MMIAALALVVSLFVLSAVAFRVVIHESISFSEQCQALSVLALCLALYSANNDNDEWFQLASALVLFAMFQWTRRVQIQGPPCGNANTLNLQGKFVLVTGGNSGIGLETAKFAYQCGATVIVASRNVELTNQVFAKELAQNDGVRIVVMGLDLESFAGVREFATQFTNKFPVLDVLVHNAGSMTPHHRLTKSDGIESMMQTNCLSPFLLTLLLMKSLRNSTLLKPRVICVTSSTSKLAKQIPLDDLNATQYFSIFYTYGTTKFSMNELFLELERQTNGQVSINLVHPGAVVTEIVRNLPKFMIRFRFLVRPWFKNSYEGSSSQSFLATNSAVEHVSGEYFEHSQVHAIHHADAQSRQAFFAKAEQLVGVQFNEIWK
ncbi:hypothetical protein BASA81_015844 [Batrachochytrium salamandrivorans]|nr:hypothetical protein BASA81_015844 [Batrachochytrium salamandrivorans]